MRLKLDFGPQGFFEVDLPGVSDADYEVLRRILAARINSKEKARDVVADVFIVALERCPTANPSDVWHHIIYRDYIRLKVGTNPNQSWVRTSGEAFETVIAHTYNDLLAPHGIRMLPMFGKSDKREALQRMGIDGDVGSEKIDLIVEARSRGAGVQDGWGIVGGVHAKVSLAERVSDDIPASRIMMRNGFISALCTLDVKSFPPPHGDLVNRGELGSPQKPTDKRQYIEAHGDFSVCVSYNARTAPSSGAPASGRSILVTGLGEQVGAQDPFVHFLIDNA